MPISYYQKEAFADEIKFRGIDNNIHTINTDIHYVSQIFRKVRNGFSPIVGICGNQRIGKSFIGLWLCRLMMEVMSKKFIPSEGTFYEPIKAIENLDNKNKESILIDEASDLLDPREWYEQTHQALKSMINTQAYKNMLYVVISPFIIDIDSAISKHFDFLLRVDARGRYKAFRFKKRFDSLDKRKVVQKIFLDDCGINMKVIPKGDWNEYLTFSIQEKERIRKNRIIKTRKKTTNIEDPIVRLKLRMKGKI